MPGNTRIKDRGRHFGRELCSIIISWNLAQLQINDLAEFKCFVVNKYCVGKLNMARLKVSHHIITQRKNIWDPTRTARKKRKKFHDDQFYAFVFFSLANFLWRKLIDLAKHGASCITVHGSSAVSYKSKRATGTSHGKLISQLINIQMQTNLLANQLNRPLQWYSVFI